MEQIILMIYIYIYIYMTKRTHFRNKLTRKGTKKRKQRRLKRNTNKRNQRRKTRRKGGMLRECTGCVKKKSPNRTPLVPPPPPPPPVAVVVGGLEEEMPDGSPISNVNEAITIWNKLYNKYHYDEYTTRYDKWRDITIPHEKKVVQAMKFLNTKAKSGDVQAQLMLAEMYVNGRHHEERGRVLSQNEKNQAKKWYQKAVAHGNAEAQYRFGQQIVYNNIIGIGPSKSVKWLRKAADQGHVMAQYTLGKIYEYGIKRRGSGGINDSDPGVGKNSKLARYWYAEAAKHEVSYLTEPEKAAAIAKAKIGATRMGVGIAEVKIDPGHESDSSHETDIDSSTGVYDEFAAMGEGYRGMTA